MVETTGYMRGNVVPRRDYEVYQPVERIRKPQIQIQEQAKPLTRQKVKINFALVAALIVLGVLLGALIYRNSLIAEVKFNLQKERTNYYNVVDLNNKLKLQIEKSLDLNQIRKTAINELGMQTPTASQKVGISVPIKDFSVVTSDESKENDGNILNGLSSLLRGVFGG